jgi:DNA-binding NtrC family response regulator
MIDERVRFLVTTIVRVVVQEVPAPILVDGSFQRPAPSDIGSFEPDHGTMKDARPRRVLVVDDETLIADSVAMILRRNGYDAIAKYRGTDALEAIHVQCPDIVVSDVVMPDFNGIELAKAVRALCPRARIVLFSGSVDSSSLLDGASMDGYEILAKPVHPLTLLKAIDGTTAG